MAPVVFTTHLSPGLSWPADLRDKVTKAKFLELAFFSSLYHKINLKTMSQKTESVSKHPVTCKE